MSIFFPSFEEPKSDILTKRLPHVLSCTAMITFALSAIVTHMPAMPEYNDSPRTIPEEVFLSAAIVCERAFNGNAPPNLRPQFRALLNRWDALGRPKLGPIGSYGDSTEQRISDLNAALSRLEDQP